MSKRRVFVAINLPEKIKNRLKEYQEKTNFLFISRGGGRGYVRWTKKDSLHLTLVFIGYVSDEEVLGICEAARKVAEEGEPFFINFKKIRVFSSGQKPRMIWVEGEKSEELIKLKNQLEKTLLGVYEGLFRREERSFNPHITLARVNQVFSALPENNLDWSQVEESFNFQVPVKSIEIMESDLRSDGAEYVVLESFMLGE